ncbi:hypothetical protein B0H63DRAFT_562144 [Podospora didyma]|uniref:Nuclear pore complex protein Nup85 n=1 Tax=Podospora didyma TaxID=330526 RepID=A0AAE0KK06_9PEZI|nr:hypothetical protein B0H63DRAFT_562144 [Podospora didyma]
MAGRFEVPSSSSPPSTPDRSSRGGRANRLPYGENPSTTPAGPPPSSAGSFTPAGAPSASFLGSSIMRGMTNTKPPAALSTQSSGAPSSNKSLFSQQRKAPLGRSIRGGPPKAHQPSRLSKSIVADDDDDNDDEEEDEARPNSNHPGTFAIPFDDSEEEEEDDMEEDHGPAGYRDSRDRYDDRRPQVTHSGDEDDEDMWLDMQESTPRHGDAGGYIGDESDLMMLTTPAATERVRQEAEDIFRASAMASGNVRQREFRYAALAKDVYNQMGTAAIVESPQLILGTEAQIERLYDDGVGEAEDEEKLEDTLAAVAGNVVSLWKEYADKIPQSEEEHAAEIGPGPNASPFENANYLANLALQVHHTRYSDGTRIRTEPLPETLFRWLGDYHNLYANQVDEILRHRPSPASHSLFWQAIFVALLRGKVGDAVMLLKQAGWGHVRSGQRGECAYKGQALENVQLATDETVMILESCPGLQGNWEIWSSDWTLFRVLARGSLDHLRRFAEGREGHRDESTFSASTRSRQSMAGMARRAESQVPWEIYENLNIIFDIVLGSQAAILEAAQDWCEATVGLFGWWDERRGEKTAGGHRASMSMSRSQMLVLASHATDSESYLDRLARAFHAAVESNFHFNSQNTIEVGMACVFEDNTKAVIGILRGWSLPVASAVAEIASLGKWLPPHQPSGILGMDDLEMDDLEVLGINPGAPDEVDGIKDNTLAQYALALADYDELSAVRDRSGDSRDGWELAIHVLGRMDSPELSEEMVARLVKHLIDGLHVDSEDTVDKIWALLNELGMIPYAEETAETYGEILARDSHRYGEAMWYYALAHRPNKVREVMNLLISVSLVQSTAYPPASDLDDHLHKLLTDRNKALEQCAKQDLEAAELLGKMLSGYASLRQFYDIRDSSENTIHTRQQAAAALVSVIASSDDNIRGGLFDQSRDGIVSEDFLLALLGEAAVFVTDPNNTNVHYGHHHSSTDQSGNVFTLGQIDTILKAIEDLEAVGSRVRNACDEFLEVVLTSTPGGLKGSTPADLLRKSSAGGSSNLMLAGSSMVASQLQRLLGGGMGGQLHSGRNTKRGWDWRKSVTAKVKGKDVMNRLRTGLAKDLASLWLAEADERAW